MFHFVLLSWIIALGESSTSPCGKVFTEKRGFIHTPNFPNAFPTPMRCSWIIDASSYTNHTIYVYFTQVFATFGISLIEYPFFDVTTNVGYSPRAVVNASEDLLNGYQYARTNDPFLVVNFQIDSFQGNHVRMLHHLMQVYGFNLTYEITADDGPRFQRCSVADCSFLGHCYANRNFSSFDCSCFPGYFGKHCGFGQLCGPQKNPCFNGGSCRYAGETQVFCECPEGYAGSKCDISITANAMRNRNANRCPYDQSKDDDEIPCVCQNPQTILESDRDRARYVMTIKLTNHTIAVMESTKSKHANQPLEKRILNQVQKHFKKVKLEKIEDLKLLNITMERGRVHSINFHFFAAKSDASKVRDAFSQMVEKNFIENSYASYKQEASLNLTKISVNRDKEAISEGSEFIVSCLASGSSQMAFRWYKNGVFINASVAQRGVRIHRTLLTHDTYSGMLIVEKAQPLHGGEYMCRATDWGYQQCKSITIYIRPKPRIKLRPLSLTVQRGENISLTCLSTGQFQTTSTFGFTWLKNENLMRMDFPNVYWEDLYVGGSVLYVSNIQESCTFQCNVRSFRYETASTRINVMDKSRNSVCPKSGNWPETMAGTVATLDCPANFSADLDALATRSCFVAEDAAFWVLPDYSNCSIVELSKINLEFSKLSLGYDNKSMKVPELLESAMKIIKDRTLLPGEGEPILTLLNNAYEISMRRRKCDDFRRSAGYFYDISNILLEKEISLQNQQAMNLFSQLMAKWTLSNYPINASNHLRFFSIHYIRDYKSFIPFGGGLSVKVGNLLLSSSEHALQSAVIVYKNLNRHWLPTFVSQEWKGEELVYELASPVAQIITPKHKNGTWFHTHATFKLPESSPSLPRILCCGTTPAFGQTWNLEICEILPASGGKSIRCSFNRVSIIGMFVAKLPAILTDTSKKQQIVILVGCKCCIVQCAICVCILSKRWCHLPSSIIYLKIQVCASTGAAMLVFLYAFNEPPLTTYPFIYSALQAFMLCSLSSHVSVLLVIYVEMISVQCIPNAKMLSVVVVTASPQLLTILTPLKRQITREKLTSWWLRRGTDSFYAHCATTAFLTVLFVFLYCCGTTKSRNIGTKLEKAAFSRLFSTLQSALVIFTTTIFVTACSITYSEFPTWANECIFASSSTFLGFLYMVCYLPSKNIFCYRVCFPPQNEGVRHSPKLKTSEKSVDNFCNGITETGIIFGLGKYNNENNNQVDFQKEKGPKNETEMLKTRVCVELEVVKGNEPFGEDSVVVCSVDVEPCPGHVLQLSELKFTTSKLDSSPQIQLDEENDDVLHRISQDLDYLLEGKSPNPSIKSGKSSLERS